MVGVATPRWSMTTGAQLELPWACGLLCLNRTANNIDFENTVLCNLHLVR